MTDDHASLLSIEQYRDTVVTLLQYILFSLTLTKSMKPVTACKLKRKYLFVETINDSCTYGFTSIPFYVRQNVNVLMQQRDIRCPVINFDHRHVYIICCGRYMVILRIYSPQKMQMFFLDYILGSDKIKAMDILITKEIEALMRLRDWMLNTYTEEDDELAVIASIYN